MTTTSTAGRQLYAAIGDVEYLPELQIRIALDEGQVEHYRTLYAQALEQAQASGEPLTKARDTAAAALGPIGVTETPDGDWLCHDGFHRTEGARRAGLTSLLAAVTPGSRQDALLRAIAANTRHGKPLNSADKNRMLELFFEAQDDEALQQERLKLPIVQIARDFSVSQGLVTKVRQQVAAEIGYNLAEAAVTVTRTTNGVTQTYQQKAAIRREQLDAGGYDELPARQVNDVDLDADAGEEEDWAPAPTRRAGDLLGGLNGSSGSVRSAALQSAIEAVVTGTVVYTIDGVDGEMAISDLGNAPRELRRAIMKALGLMS